MCVRARVCARESRDELASPRQEKNRRKALRGAASGCGGGDNKEVCLFFPFFRTFLSLHGWRRRIFLSAWHTWHRKGTNSFVKTHTAPQSRMRSQRERTRLSFRMLVVLIYAPAHLCNYKCEAGWNAHLWKT